MSTTRLFVSRSLPRAQCVARTSRPRAALVRTYATETTKSHGISGLTGGLIGGGVAFGLGYTWYHFSGVKTAVQTANQAKGYVDNAVQSIKDQVPGTDASVDDIIKTLRKTANTYAVFIPGGKAFVDNSFRDIDTLRQKHGGEVDKIVREASSDLRKVSEKGFSLETAEGVVKVLVKHLSRLSELAGDAAQDLLNQHPELKKKVGGSVQQLKDLGDKFGPEVQKQVNEVQDEVRDILKNGLQADSVSKIQKLVQEKTEKIKQAGEKSFNQGFKELQPLLEKNPKVKQFVQDNLSDLKSGNIAKIGEQIRNAIKTGDTKELEQYVEQAKGKGSKQLSQWFSALPDGSHVFEQLSSLQEIAKTKGSEAEGLLKETIDEIKKVLEDKVKKAKDLGSKK